jgi:DNA-binding MarR family transcriptional regulator
MPPTADDCAHELLDVIPEVMQVIRAEVRHQRGRDLSILQLRALAFLNRHPGVTLSAVADHVGLTLSSMSTQITKLVQRKLVQREESPHDRRYVTLTLTVAGQATLDAARRGAQTNLALRCEQLSAEERVQLIETLQILRSLFASPPPTIEMEQ